MKLQPEAAKKGSEQLLQWHPAFFAGLQIEFGNEAKYLQFEQEHQLGTKPMSIDVLIKKDRNRSIHKNIGRIFREHNIIEYKGPGDYLSVDDFYKVYGYACFYKADATRVNEVRIEELTISLISEGYPRKLLKHLQEDKGLQVIKKEEGIYYITGDKIPMQLIVTGKLSAKENLWLRNLTNHLEGRQAARELLEDYKNHDKNSLYKSVMNIIVRANKKEFQEVKDMCEALEELMHDELEERRRLGMQQGIQQGIQQGENRVNDLNMRLSKLGRTDDILKAAADKGYQRKLFQEFGL